MDIAGPVYVKINNKYKITITGLSVEKAQNTKVHVGGFGVFGTSQSAGIMITGSFKVSIPEDGVEFDPDVEFKKPGGQLLMETPSGNFRRAYTGVRVSKGAFTNDQAQGTLEQTVNFTAELERKM